jgi:hypothetical protein
VSWFKQRFSRRRRYHELSESIPEHPDETIEELIDNGLSGLATPLNKQMAI